MKRYLLLSSILGFIIIAGCVGEPELSYSTNVTIGGVSALPEATSDETYRATIIGQGGTKPYTCELVEAADIGGTLSLSKTCIISGTAPTAFENKIIPFKVNLTDATGKSTVFEMHLTVNPPPVLLELPEKLPDAQIGDFYEYSFCNPQVKFNCGKEDTINPTGGNPPYTFTVSGQPMGLIIQSNGVLSGTIPEELTEKTYTLDVCAKDIVGSQSCGKVPLQLIKKEEVFKTDWTIQIEGTGSYSDVEYGINYNQNGGFSFMVLDGKIEGTGTGQATVSQDYSGCIGNSMFEASYSVKGSVSEDTAVITLSGSSPSEHTYSIDCGYGAQGTTTVKSPFDFEGEYITVKLEDGTIAEKTISILGDHARTFTWTFTVIG